MIYHPVNSKIEYEKKHTVGYPGFFDRDELFYKHIFNYKKLDFNLFKSDFKFVFENECYPHIESEFQ